MTQRTQVAIVGAGPAGLMLGHLLTREGIDNVIIERQSADYVLGRIRAGVLEQGTVDLLEQSGAGHRMRAEGLPHHGFELSFDGDTLRIDLQGLTGRSVMVYGQTEVTRDLMALRAQSGAPTLYEANDVAARSHRLAARRCASPKPARAARSTATSSPAATASTAPAAPASRPQRCAAFERVIPVRLARRAGRPPTRRSTSWSMRTMRSGFALCSMRSATRSRYYLQVPDGRAGRGLAGRPLLCRAGPAAEPGEWRPTLQPGPSIEKSIAPLRSFVAEPLRFGRLFLAGDAAHIVPPTGAKGLNLAIHDVRCLFEALCGALSRRHGRGHRALFPARARPDLEDGAVQLVDDDAASHVPAGRCVQSTDAAGRVRRIGWVALGAARAGGELHRPDRIACPRAAACWRRWHRPQWQYAPTRPQGGYAGNQFEQHVRPQRVRHYRSDLGRRLRHHFGSCEARDGRPRCTRRSQARQRAIDRRAEQRARGGGHMRPVGRSPRPPAGRPRRPRRGLVVMFNEQEHPIATKL